MQTSTAFHAHPIQSTPPSPDLDHISLVFRERGWIVGVCAAAGLICAAIHVSRLPLVYEAQAILQLEPHGRVLGFEADNGPYAASDAGVQTILETFKGRELIGRVVSELKLATDPQFSSSPLTEEQAQNTLRGCVEVKQRRGTQLLDILARHSNAEVSKKIADGFAHSFIQLQLDQRSASARSVLEFLITEADRLKSRLRKSEEALQSYKENNQAASLEERQDTVITDLKIQGGNLASARATRIRLESDVADMERFAGDTEALLRITSVAQHPRIGYTRAQIADLQSQISTLQLRYTEKHPKLIFARTQLREAEGSLQKLVLQIPTTLKSDLERALATEINFENALRDQEKQALALNRQSIDYKVLSRDVETDRAVYESILRKLKETDVARGVQISDSRIFESATLPKTPAHSTRLKFLAIGLLAGVFLGSGAVFGTCLLESTWRTAEEIESATGLAVLSTVPRLSRKNSGKPLVERMRDSSEPLMEAFRSLRTSLHLSARKKGKHCFLVTGPQPGDGKSFCAIGYALTLARQGVKTLLIDADLRSPSLEQTLFRSRSRSGLTDVLEGHLKLSDAIIPTSISGLDFLPAGSLLQNASELLTCTGVQSTLEEARMLYDCLILDSAPLQTVSDSLLLAQSVDSILLVVRYGETAKKAAHRAIQQFEDQGTPVAGIVFNSANPTSLYKDYAPSGAVRSL
jgi:capsular exopolysaccharide synthesis family protein